MPNSDVNYSILLTKFETIVLRCIVKATLNKTWTELSWIKKWHMLNVFIIYTFEKSRLYGGVLI